MQSISDWVRVGFGWVEIAGGIVALSLIAWFLIELLRDRISLRRLRGNGWL